MSHPLINKARNILRSVRTKLALGATVVTLAVGAFTLYYDPVSGELGVSTQVTK